MNVHCGPIVLVSHLPSPMQGRTESAADTLGDKARQAGDKVGENLKKAGDKIKGN